jgi:hypothetical protein
MDFPNAFANATSNTAGTGGIRNSQNSASLSSQRENKTVLLLHFP